MNIKNLNNKMSLLIKYLSIAFINIIIIAELINGFKVEVQTAEVHCMQHEDEQVVDWHTIPLSEYFSEGQEKHLKIASHLTGLSLAKDLLNDIELKIFKLCKMKLVVTLKIVNGLDGKADGVLIDLNHAWDAKVNKSAKFARQFAIKVQQSDILQMYKLKVAHEAINAEPTERVTEKKSSKSENGSEENCNNTDHPTCPLQKNIFDDSLNRESAGFCCFCDGKSTTKAGTRDEQNCKGSQEKRSSAHCVKLSKYWYSSYEIQGPVVDHQVSLRFFVLKESSTGGLEWTNMTRTPALLSYPGPYDETSHFVKNWKMKAAYRKENEHLPQDKQYLDSLHHRILIPKYYDQPIDDEFHGKKSEETPPEFSGSFGQKALVVNRTQIDKTGETCDKVGVLFKGFKNQKNPCDLPIGSCLHNQPFALWKNEENRLKNFGSLNSNGPIKEYKNDVYIAFDHKKGLTNFIDFELIADDLFVMRSGYSVWIVTVRVDFGTSGGKVLAEIENREFAHSAFHVRIVKCDEKLIPYVKSKVKTIPPRQLTPFTINVRYNGTKKSKKSTCTLVAVNRFNEIVAARQVLFSSNETCICNKDCKCSCQSDGFQCIPLEKNLFHPTGFDNQIYEILNSVEPRYTIFIYVIAFIILILILLLILGVYKWLILDPLSICRLRCSKNNMKDQLNNDPKLDFNEENTFDSETDSSSSRDNISDSDSD